MARMKSDKATGNNRIIKQRKAIEICKRSHQRKDQPIIIGKLHKQLIGKDKREEKKRNKGKQRNRERETGQKIGKRKGT